MSAAKRGSVARSTIMSRARPRKPSTKLLDAVLELALDLGADDRGDALGDAEELRADAGAGDPAGVGHGGAHRVAKSRRVACRIVRSMARMPA
jgi:hypothetical protein